MLASEAMRPSNATSEWHDRLKRLDIAALIAAGMDRLAVVEAPNPEMEALAIAVAMREARHLDKSVALVTPDRALARRVTVATLPGAGVAPAARSMIQVLTDVARRYDERTGDE